MLHTHSVPAVKYTCEEKGNKYVNLAHKSYVELKEMITEGICNIIFRN
jgi:hypothetical protein